MSFWGELVNEVGKHFGEQLKQSESFEFQNEVSELLWFFKEQISTGLAQGETINFPSK